MDARAGWIEAGYSMPQAKWSPTVSYRLAMFSGDDPTTATYERWDPMLSGGTGEQWVQGANHFKVVQDSNVIAHRIQARFRPNPKVEIVPSSGPSTPTARRTSAATPRSPSSTATNTASRPT
jgi:hypothetical protein